MYERWGYPVYSAPIGVELWAWFQSEFARTKYWKKIIVFLSLFHSTLTTSLQKTSTLNVSFCVNNHFSLIGYFIVNKLTNIGRDLQTNWVHSFVLHCIFLMTVNFGNIASQFNAIYIYIWTLVKSSPNSRNFTIGAVKNFRPQSQTSQPHRSFRPEGHYNSFNIHRRHHTKETSFNTLRYGTLPHEAVCTENLTPWIKLLPCRSHVPIAHIFVLFLSNISFYFDILCFSQCCCCCLFFFHKWEWLFLCCVFWGLICSQDSVDFSHLLQYCMMSIFTQWAFTIVQFVLMYHFLSLFTSFLFRICFCFFSPRLFFCYEGVIIKLL